MSGKKKKGASRKPLVYIQHNTKADRDGMREAQLAWARQVERDKLAQKGGRPKGVKRSDTLDDEDAA